MNVSARHVRAIVRKELREYRRNRPLLVTMTILPLIFLIQPSVAILVVQESSAATLAQGHALLYMLGIPVLVPAAIAASTVVTERQQTTLEPVLTTPITREELLLGKALAVLLPSVAIAYLMYAIFLGLVVLFAQPGVPAAIIRGPDILAQVIFTPLIALLSIWIGLAISTRSSDARVAQQLSLLGSLPMVAVSSLIAFDVIHATLGLALGLAALLVVLDRLGWRIVSAAFDRERLITGTR
jgi:ABC-type transport system involved in multi-copper enzyme maturation permease subunit